MTEQADRLLQQLEYMKQTTFYEEIQRRIECVQMPDADNKQELGGLHFVATMNKYEHALYDLLQSYLKRLKITKSDFQDEHGMYTGPMNLEEQYDQLFDALILGSDAADCLLNQAAYLRCKEQLDTLEKEHGPVQLTFVGRCTIAAKLLSDCSEQTDTDEGVTWSALNQLETVH
jgi:hypothetical protein